MSRMVSGMRRVSMAGFALLFRMEDARRLDFYLRWLVVMLLLHLGTWLLDWREWLTAWGFHYTAETRHWYNPDPWPLLPRWLVPFYAVGLVGSGLAIIWGWRTRFMVWLFFGAVLYAMLVDVDSAFTINKYGVLFLALIALSYAPGMVTTREETDGSVRRWQPVWPIRLIMLACLLQYFTSGYCKVVHGDWLRVIETFPYREVDPTVLWTQTMGVYRTGFAAWLLHHTGPWFWSAGMIFTLAFELGAPLLFLIRPLRMVGIAGGILLHLGIALLMYKLIFFSLQMVTFYLLFLDPETIVSWHAWWGRCIKQPMIRWWRRRGGS